MKNMLLSLLLLATCVTANAMEYRYRSELNTSWPNCPILFTSIEHRGRTIMHLAFKIRPEDSKLISEGCICDYSKALQNDPDHLEITAYFLHFLKQSITDLGIDQFLITTRIPSCMYALSYKMPAGPSAVTGTPANS